MVIHDVTQLESNNGWKDIDIIETFVLCHHYLFVHFATVCRSITHQVLPVLALATWPHGRLYSILLNPTIYVVVLILNRNRSSKDLLVFVSVTNIMILLALCQGSVYLKEEPWTFREESQAFRWALVSCKLIWSKIGSTDWMYVFIYFGYVSHWQCGRIFRCPMYSSLHPFYPNLNIYLFSSFISLNAYRYYLIQ